MHVGLARLALFGCMCCLNYIVGEACGLGGVMMKWKWKNVVGKWKGKHGTKGEVLEMHVMHGNVVFWCMCVGNG